ncbi:hypothetical protein HTZ84_21195 [Haloterrigena sp. SYSU A558-1]|uniref:Uncharacterized protein n=1 Tax=Haloterrigena gelatinilytica TaxID=2741724 RepID=A0ABX2LEU9_9EURY|nr:hypothetical protein [Haloterrigena gelatinilytica]NUC74782.1 hypothetical protein [Haloterrigena gelatinilytica]
MGFGHDSEDEIIVEAKDKTSSAKPIPADHPESDITQIIVDANGDEHQYRVTSSTQVKPIKGDVGMPDARALYTASSGKTLRLNDDDLIADYLDDGDTLALKPDAVFG